MGTACRDPFKEAMLDNTRKRENLPFAIMCSMSRGFNDSVIFVMSLPQKSYINAANALK
jgi:hypothetical protein